MIGNRFASQAVSLLQVAILGRLLAPDDFGLMGIALLASQAIAIFVYTGYEFALVQAPTLNEDDIHTAWWVMLGRRIVIGLVLLFLSYPIANFYKTLEAVPILAAMSLTQIVLGLSNPTPSLLQRELDYKRLFIYQFGSSLMGFAAGVIAAFIFKNVWALFIATFTTATTQMILSYTLHSYRPKLRFSKKSAKKFSSFGVWMLGSAVLWFIFSQGTNAFSGWMFGLAALGIYQMAGRFSLIPSTQLGEVILATVFPAYSIMQDDKERLTRAFQKVLTVSSTLIVGSTIFIAVFLPPIFTAVLGQKWAEAEILIPAIAISGCGTALLRTASPLFLGKGLPRLQFWMDLAQTSVMVLFLFPLGKHFGLIGLPYAAIAGVIAALPIWLWGVKETTNISALQIFNSMIPAVIGSAAVVAIDAIGKMVNFPGKGNLLELLWLMMMIVIAVGGFIVVLWLLNKIFPKYQAYTELRILFTQIINGLDFRRTNSRPGA